MIKQIYSNDILKNDILKIKTDIWQFCLINLEKGGFLAILILVLLYGWKENKSVGGLIFGIGLSGYILCISKCAFIFEVDILTFYLEQDIIKIKMIFNCSYL